jgi:hypothetical protein
VVESVLWNTGTQMPINRLLKDSKLGAEEIARLNAAYSYALRELSMVDRNDPLTEEMDRVPECGVAGGGTPRSPARAGPVSWRSPEG